LEDDLRIAKVNPERRHRWRTIGIRMNPAVLLLAIIAVSSSALAEEPSTVEFVRPKFNRIPIDACLSLGGGCGQFAADYYCRMNGFRGGSTSFPTVASEEPTFVLRGTYQSGQFCNNDNMQRCDTFAAITCKS
jgi:hypothetical protein